MTEYVGPKSTYMHRRGRTQRVVYRDSWAVLQRELWSEPVQMVPPAWGCRDRGDIMIVLSDTLPFTGHRFSLADSQINIFKATQATEWYWTNNLGLTHKSFRKVSVRLQEIEKFTFFLSAFFQILIAKKLALFHHLHCYRVIVQLLTLIKIYSTRFKTSFSTWFLLLVEILVSNKHIASFW